MTLTFPCRYDPLANFNGNALLYGSWVGDAQVTALFGVLDWLHLWRHSGLDLWAPEACPIVPLLPGVVRAKGSAVPVGTDGWESGNWVSVDYDKPPDETDQISGFFCHMRLPTLLDVGDRVEADTVLGGVGHTGKTSRDIEAGGTNTGDHVHVTINVNGVPVDPLTRLSGSTHAPGYILDVGFAPSATQALVVFSGGTVAELEAAAKAKGATGVWVQDGVGTFHLLIVDGPDFLRQQFAAAFPNGLPMAAVTLVKEG